MSSALINHERIDTDVKQYPMKIELVDGYSEDLSNATFKLLNEDHTIGNSLRYIIMKNPNVEFCGYSIPHPSEPVVNLRIQMYDGLSSVDALYKGLDDLEGLFSAISNSYRALSTLSSLRSSLVEPWGSNIGRARYRKVTQHFPCKLWPLLPRASPVMSKDQKKHKKESILDLNKYVNTEINVQFQGGRHATGTLKGFDQLMNLVIDGVVEYLPDNNQRTLGLVVLRGPSITLLNPSQGHEQIANPFV